MDDWDGKERRDMNQDDLERDRLLTRLDTNVTFLVDSNKNMTQSLVDHARVDDRRFSDIDKTLREINDKSIFFYGKIYGGSAVITAISIFLMKLLKIGG